MVSYCLPIYSKYFYLFCLHYRYTSIPSVDMTRENPMFDMEVAFIQDLLDVKSQIESVATTLDGL